MEKEFYGPCFKPTDCFLCCCKLRLMPKAVTLRLFGVAVCESGGSIPLTFGLGGIFISLEALKAGIVGPVGGTIWNLLTISMAFLTLSVSGRKDGST